MVELRERVEVGGYPGMIEVKDVSKWFFIKRDIFHALVPPRKTIVLESINLTVKRNEVFALLGPNGAGKTTLIKIICGLILPDKGKVTVNGKIGYVSGDVHGFYPQLTGKQNLEFFGVMYDLSKSQIKERIRAYSQMLGIDDLDKPFWNYSTGTKHKLCLLRILMVDAEVIMMDEPTKSLDPLSADQFRGYMDRLSKEFGKTIIFATHSLHEAETIADRIAIMNKGEILSRGNLSELKSQVEEGKLTLEILYKEVIERAEGNVS